MTPVASLVELEQETQSFVSRDDKHNKFKPFQNERDSIGKLINRAKSNETTSRFHFLKSQQMVLQKACEKTTRNSNPAYKWSTTNLLGLTKREITPKD